MGKFLGRVAEEQLKEKETAQRQLASWKPDYEYLTCFDVDGHLLDNMTSKQVIVFHPHFMDILGLRDIESFYRLHAEHHNLWSTDRGCDRHEAQSFTCGSLLEDPVLAKTIDPAMKKKLESIKTSLAAYIGSIGETGGAYGFDSLFAFQQSHGEDPNLTRLVIWSKACDLTFPFVTIPMQPFPNVRETLEFVSERADVLIVSKTPYDDICNWLERHDLIQYVTAVSGKEQGGKDEHICLAMGGEYEASSKKVTKQGARYQAQNVIMGGDGGGDMKAVKKNGGFFFPTPPGREEEAWRSAVEEVFGPFFEGKYAEAEAGKIEAFEAAMLTDGPWQADDYDHETAYAKLQPKRKQLYEELKPGGRLFGR